ncbi:protein tyrosine phosphatase [Stylonychia lemnae]|uniref:Protein tyrosine phosphatase n=1 Tax=Stylonychia lemnae TaxID=5949 RepID=A0A078BB39_STYLE|nr:protein tyrosine phosphatase [Stylonychia lemnae]|eukprot:CDW91614.1 protein tyrosine phosphatase [Stylonychia lemnae]
MSAPVDSIMKQTIKVYFYLINSKFLQDLKRNNCDILVRTCEKTYNEEQIVSNGINIIELAFPDGNSPPRKVIQQWLKIVSAHRLSKIQSQSLLTTEDDSDQMQSDGNVIKSEQSSSSLKTKKIKQKPSKRIGIHCLAGLGRAPVLVAIALIEFGMNPEQAINLIRSQRVGAINHSQAQFILKYKKRKSFSKCSIF